MKTMVLLSSLLLLPQQTSAARLTIDVSSYQWEYVYLKEIFGEIHLLKNKKEPSQIIHINRDLKVKKPNEKFDGDFMVNYCLQLSEDMLVEIDMKNNICSQQFKVDDKIITHISFPTSRKSEVPGSYYWNSLSLKGGDFEKAKKMIVNIKDQLEKHND